MNLVTGATGFIGQHVVDHLLLQGHEVRVLTRGSNPVPELWHNRLEVIYGELSDHDAVRKAVKGCHTVYHLAAEIRDSAKMVLVNVEGTRCLLKTCQQERVRNFLYLSSVGVLGGGGKPVKLDETSPAHPRNVYETTKYKAEQIAFSYKNLSDLKIVVVRPTIVYGEYCNPQQDSFLKLCRAVKRGYFLHFGYNYLSSYVYAGDVAAACLVVVRDARTGGGCYIVNEPMPLITFVAEMAKIMGVKSPGVLPKPFGFILENILRKMERFGSLYNYTTYSIERILDLGFSLPYGYRIGLRRTIQWYEENNLL